MGGVLSRGMGEGKLEELELRRCLDDSKLQQLIPGLLSAPLSSISLLNNRFSAEAAKQLVEAATKARTKHGHLESLIGMHSGSSAEGLTDSDATLISFDLQYRKAPLLELYFGGKSQRFTAIGVEALAVAPTSRWAGGAAIRKTSRQYRRAIRVTSRVAGPAF